MFLRSDDREKWENLNKAVEAKLGKHYIGLITRKDLPKVKEIFESRIDDLRKELTEKLAPSLEILKGAASSSVKPKRLKRTLDVKKKDDARTIRERLEDADKEEQERESKPFDDDVEDTEESVENSTESVEEIPEEEAVSEEELMPEEGQTEEVPIEDEQAVNPEMVDPNAVDPETGMPMEDGMEQTAADQMPEDQLVNDYQSEGQMAEGQDMMADPEMAEEMSEEDMLAHPEDAGNMNVANPDPTMAQANLQAQQEQMMAIEDELQRLRGALSEIRGLSEEQGLLTEEELNNIIIPLVEETENLMHMMQEQKDYRQQPQGEYGPRNHAGDISRELQDQSTTFARSSKNDNLSKKTIEKLRDGITRDVNKSNFYKDEGKGWHGDPEGHAEAARARWAGQTGTTEISTRSAESEGAATKPKKNPAIQAGKKVVEVGGEVAREMGRDTARALKRAGRGIADTVGDTIADYGGEAVVAGMTAYLVSTLKGEKRTLKEYLNDMKSETLARIDEVKDWKVVRRLSRSNEAKVLRQLASRAKGVASKAGGTQLGRLSGNALRFAGAAAKNNPRVAAALFLASALGAEGAKRAGAKVKETKGSKPEKPKPKSKTKPKPKTKSKNKKETKRG